MKFKRNLRCFCNDRLSNKYLLVHKSNSILSNSQYFMMMFTDRMRKVTLCEISRIVIFLYLKFRKYFYSLIANYKEIRPRTVQAPRSKITRYSYFNFLFWPTSKKHASFSFWKCSQNISNLKTKFWNHFEFRFHWRNYFTN